MIPGGEAGTLNLTPSMGPLVPALASAVRIFWPWPGAIAAAEVELILVVSVPAEHRPPPFQFMGLSEVSHELMSFFTNSTHWSLSNADTLFPKVTT